MPAREKSASTPSLISNASSCSSEASSSYNSNHKSSLSSVKSDTSDVENKKESFTTTKALPGDDFEDIPVDDQQSISSGNSGSSSVVFPLISAEGKFTKLF